MCRRKFCSTNHDFSVGKNNVHDTTLLEERLDTIKETGANEL